MGSLKSRALSAILASCVALALIPAQPARAGVQSFHLNGGVSGRNYWIDPNMINYSKYEPEIVNAVQSWNDTQTQGTKVSFSRTLNYCCTSVSDFYAKDYANPNWVAVTAYFHSDGTLAMPSLGALATSNWDYAEISIDNADAGPVTDTLRIRALPAHEFGHAVGLTHTAVESALMYEFFWEDFYWNRYHTYYPKSDDVQYAAQL